MAVCKAFPYLGIPDEEEVERFADGPFQAIKNKFRASRNLPHFLQHLPKAVRRLPVIRRAEVFRLVVGARGALEVALDLPCFGWRFYPQPRRGYHAKPGLPC